ncbi:MAG: hypothetical protein ACI4JZ_04465 [Oscillospiraceae bacterium]
MSICENCGEIRLVELFQSAYEYLQCIDYIKALIENGGFELVEGNCALNEVKDENGQWADDIIYHLIRCKKCGKEYSCCCNTYRGGGGFLAGR